MEEKLLTLIKLANELSEKQDKIYAQIEYHADNSKKLGIYIIQKDNYTYIEKCTVMQQNNASAKLDLIISFFKEFVGGVANE